MKKVHEKDPVTISSLVAGLIESIAPLFDEKTDFIFWGSLIHSLGNNGIGFLHEISGRPEFDLRSDYDKFMSLKQKKSHVV